MNLWHDTVHPRCLELFERRTAGDRFSRQDLRALQRRFNLASFGDEFVRHPQFVAIVIMFGLLLQWPTMVALLVFPVLVIIYARLARREERDVRAQFGEAWDGYVAWTLAFVPRLRRLPKAAMSRVS